MIMNNQGNSGLSNEKKLLLQAALLSDQTGLNSWQQWRDNVDIENLDNESYHLLPLLYRNLSANEVIDVHIGRLKGVYRRTWVENQVLFQAIAPIFQSFQEKGIKTLLLKDAALNLHYYRDNGLRMMPNLEILIHPSDVLMGINLLQNIGWKEIGKIPQDILPFSQAMGFKNSSNQFVILRWHLFADGFTEKAENDFWVNTIITKLGELELHILNPTNQLLYICGAFKNQLMSSSKLADATIIINTSENQIDWKQLIIKAQKYRLIWALKNMTTALQEILNIPIPSSICTEITNLQISSFEYREYQILTKENNSVLDRLNLRYYQYARMITDNNGKLNFLGFTQYLQYLWGLENLWQVPYHATIKGIKRLVPLSRN
ncbi:nucleotidyltransferase family protein [Anabaena catenula]|uniref:Nucleotidyltransferase family protein n=1 Tax=Anabaena catenula FACHB-362 TaxID=2692877 RepID=A0ABR8J3E0_9NOST|nr:nucleotidyltransferase family protein [Anabaena catenula]MBD2691969.1 nucleotidyltransferase family protein [Anabaena catenula FACHB-362]